MQEKRKEKEVEVYRVGVCQVLCVNGFSCRHPTGEFDGQLI
jgi:hypothetical protein